MPRITVLMGIYNCADTLPTALDSLLAQTYSDFKIVLCDDGSTDATYEVAKRYANAHLNIVLISNGKNKGLNYTLNHCLEYADTEYVARMDGDDLSKPTRFEEEIKFLDAHPEYTVVSCPMEYFDEKGIFKTGRGLGEVNAKSFLMGSPICHAPCMARTVAIKSVGGYSVDDRLLRVEDYHLWFKLFAAGYKLFMLDKPLYQMRDDRNAVARRSWKNRKNEFHVKHLGFKMIGLPWYYQVFALKPIMIYLLPTSLYRFLHRRRTSK